MHSATKNCSDQRKGIVFGHIYCIDTIRNDQKRPQVTLFDSYGRFSNDFPPSRICKIIKRYAKNHKASIFINRKLYQLEDAPICSHLSIYFILQRSRGHTLKCIHKNKLNEGEREMLLFVPKIVECLLPFKSRKYCKDVYKKNCFI